jgi:histidinol-phosphate aminotransferase
MGEVVKTGVVHGTLRAMTLPRSLFREAVRSSVGYVPGEQPRDRTYIKLNSNENPYPPSPRVLEAVLAAVREELRLYPDPMATNLRRVASEVYGLPPESILVGNGSDELLGMLFRGCIEAAVGASTHESRVAYPMPTYSYYETLAAMRGCQAVTVPFPDDFSLPVEALIAADARLILVCNPNAPSGTFTEVSVIGELARRARGLVVVDEAYVDFAPASCVSLVPKHENVLVLRTFSKSYSLAGMRIGLALGPPPLMRELYKLKDSYNVSRLALVAAQAALEDKASMEENARKVRESRALLTEALRSLGYEVLPSEANFVLARRRGHEAAAAYRALRDAGILVRYFDLPALRDALRITVGLPEHNEAVLEVLTKLG